MSEFATNSVSSTTILVVDDNAEMVEFLRIYLSRHGMRVLLAYDGRQCLEMVRREPIDIIVLDVMMPGMDGITTCTALKSLPEASDIPVLLLTAKDDNTTRLAGIEAGICEFLTKPVRGKILLDYIRSQLAVRQWERKLDQLSDDAFSDEIQM